MKEKSSQLKLSLGTKEFTYNECVLKRTVKKVRKYKVTEYSEKGKYPIIDQGKALIGGFTDEKNEVLDFNQPVVIFGDHTLNLKYVNFPFARGADGIQIIIPNENIVYPKFLYYLLLLKLSKIKVSNYERHFKYINTIKFILPDLSEQKIISSKLDKQMTEIELIKKATEVAQSAIEVYLPSFIDNKIAEIDCTEIEFRDLVLEFRYGSSTKATKENNEGTPILRIPNIIGGEIDVKEDSLVYVHLGNREKLNLMLRKGDLLFVRTNGNPRNIGRCSVFAYEDDKYAFASYLIRARIKTEHVLPEFLDMLFKEGQGRKQLLERAKTSAGNFNINIESLKSIKLKIPTVQDQKRLLKDFNLFKEELYKIQLNQEAQVRAIAQLNISVLDDSFKQIEPDLYK